MVGALIGENNIVVNIIEVEKLEDMPNCVDCKNYCAMGDIYDPVTGEFTKPEIIPPPEQTPNEGE